MDIYIFIIGFVSIIMSMASLIKLRNVKSDRWRAVQYKQNSAVIIVSTCIISISSVLSSLMSHQILYIVVASIPIIIISFTYITRISDKSTELSIIDDFHTSVIRNDNLEKENLRLNRLLNSYIEKYTIESSFGDVDDAEDFNNGEFVFKVISSDSIIDLSYFGITIYGIGDNKVFTNYTSKDIVCITEMWKSGYQYISNSTVNPRTYICLSSNCVVNVDDNVINMSAGQSVDVPPKSKFFINSEDSDYDIYMLCVSLSI